MDILVADRARSEFTWLKCKRTRKGKDENRPFVVEFATINVIL